MKGNQEIFKLYIDHGSTDGIFLSKINRKQLKSLRTEKINNAYVSKLGRSGLARFADRNNIPSIIEFLRLSPNFYVYAEKEV